MKHSAKIREHASAMRKRGLTLNEISKKLNVPFYTAAYLCKGTTPFGSGRGRPVKGQWKLEWNKLLGTTTDRNLAVKFGVSETLVTSHRLAHRIPSYARQRKTEISKKIAKCPDRELASEAIATIAKRYNVTKSSVAYERRYRGIKFAVVREDISTLRRAAVAGMLTAYARLDKPAYDGIQSRIAEILKVSRERARKLCSEVRGLLKGEKPCQL